MMEIILDIINVIENFIQSEHFDISIFQNLYLALLTILIPISLYILQEKDFSFEWEKIAIIDKIIRFGWLTSCTIIFFISLLFIKSNIWFIFSILAILSILIVILIIVNSLRWILDIYDNNFRYKIRVDYVKKLPYDKKLDFWRMTWSKDILDSRFEEYLLNNFFRDLYKLKDKFVKDINDKDKLNKNPYKYLYDDYLNVFVSEYLKKLGKLDKPINTSNDNGLSGLFNFNWQLYLEKIVEHHKTLSISLYNNFHKVKFAYFIRYTHNILSKSDEYPDDINKIFNMLKNDPKIYKYIYPNICNEFLNNIVDEDKKSYVFYLNSESQLGSESKDYFQISMFNKFKEYIKVHYIRSFISFRHSSETNNTSKILEYILKISEIIFQQDEYYLKQIILFDFILILKISDFITNQKESDTKLLKDLYEDLKKNVRILEPTIVYIGDSDPSRKEEIQYTRQILSAFGILNDTFENSMEILKSSDDEELKKIYNRLKGYLDTKTS